MEHKKLPHGAYGGVHGEAYTPLLNHSQRQYETHRTTIFIGVLMAALFASANAYLGLMSGLTVAAGIPGAILGAGLLSVCGKKSMAATNIVQVMAAGGESFSSGIIFVLPALIIMGSYIDFWVGISIGLLGVFLGVGFTSFIRKYLIVESHGTLLFPEAMAASETILSAHTGGFGLRMMLIGSAIGSFFVALSNAGLGLFHSRFTFSETTTHRLTGPFKYWFVGEINPALIGVGFIVGKDVGLMMMSGALLSGFILIPLLHIFSDTLALFGPTALPISAMNSELIFKNVIRYIGAGTIATGGIISVIRLIPLLIHSIKAAFAQTATHSQREDISPWISFIAIISTFMSAIVFALSLQIPIFYALIGGFLTIMMSLLFSVVSARLSGQVGTSNLPVSGMTIASLLMIASVLSWSMNLMQINQKTIILFIILFLSIVVTTIAISGGFAQSIKATYIIGGSSRIAQRFFILGSIIGIFCVIPIIMVLHSRIMTDESIAAQANLISILATGIVTGKLPWLYIFIGVLIALILYAFKLPVMSFAIGMYLPMSVSLCVLAGGLVRFMVEKKYHKDPVRKEHHISTGTIISSGMIAGASLIGLFLALIGFFVPLPLIHIPLSSLIQSILSLGIFLVLCAILYIVTIRKKAEF